ncbi:MAG: cell division protein SepF, partial [Candidatus Nanopelagicales bacterium]
MSTLHKVKAYFGMAPSDDYEDEYYEDERDGVGRDGGRSRLGRRGDRFADDDF